MGGGVNMEESLPLKPLHPRRSIKLGEEQTTQTQPTPFHSHPSVVWDSLHLKLCHEKQKHAKPFVFQEAAKSNKQASVSEQGKWEDAAQLRVYTHLTPLPRQSSPNGSTEGKEEEEERVERTSRGMTEGGS